MVRTVFQIIILLVIVLEGSISIFCSPSNSFLEFDNLNNIPYFYYGDVEKFLFKNDLEILINNFDNVSFDIIKYVKTDSTTFKNYSPLNHYNLIFELQHQCLNYYLSLPFSHNSTLKYYEYLSGIDLKGDVKNQYWCPYIGVHDKNHIKIDKLNITLNNYIFNNSFRVKIYDIFKMYIHK